MPRVNAEVELQTVLNDNKKLLNDSLSLACLKLLWRHRMEHGTDTYRLDVVDPVDPPKYVTTIAATPANLRTHLEGFMIEIRRTLINDMFLCIARHGVLARNIIDNKRPIAPEFHKEAHEGEVLALGTFLTKEDKLFLDFFRRLRNSTVHYNGNHNRRNRLDYEFNGSHFLTTDANIGRQIDYWFSDLFALHAQLEVIFATPKLLAQPFLLKMLSENYGA